MIELVFAYLALTAVLAAAASLLGPEGRTATWLLGVAAASALGAFAARILLAGHLPKFGTFEESLGSAAAIFAASFWMAWRQRRQRVGVGAALVGALLLSHGLLFSPARHPLTISEQSLWLDLHVVLAWLVSVSFALTAGYAWALLRGDASATRGLTRGLQLAFLLHSALFLSGAWYSLKLFGQAISLDPIELLWLIAWLSVASVLHLRRYRALRGRPYAMLGLVVVVLLIASFRLIVHLSPSSTYHIIDLELRLHG